mmetsp:Transcript_56916/g.101576  ORF Transcript_56916/g.101576 Transcript_56916/m.101576 type:complete len:284 (-) Transcript_56916:492-1343(-)
MAISTWPLICATGRPATLTCAPNTHHGHPSSLLLPFAPTEVRQELHVSALGALDWADDGVQVLEPKLLNTLHRPVNDFLSCPVVFYYTLLAHLLDLLLPCLKLRLDECNDLPVSILGEQPPHSRHHLQNANEGEVQRDQVHWSRSIGQPIQIPQVGPLNHRDTWVNPHLLMHLSVSHIHAVHMPCPTLQQAVCEATCGQPCVQDPQALNANAELFQSLLQLEAGPAHELWWFCPQLHVLHFSRFYLVPTLQHLCVLDKHLSCGDKPLNSVFAVLRVLLDEYGI